MDEEEMLDDFWPHTGIGFDWCLPWFRVRPKDERTGLIRVDDHLLGVRVSGFGRTAELLWKTRV